jgi:hypothetical protein
MDAPNTTYRIELSSYSKISQAHFSGLENELVYMLKEWIKM